MKLEHPRVGLPSSTAVNLDGHLSKPACICQVQPTEVELIRRDYTANGGWETFLAYEDPRQDILVGLLRLRRVSGLTRQRQPELTGRASMVRELHVYGTAVAVHARDASKHQHQVELLDAPLC